MADNTPFMFEPGPAEGELLQFAPNPNPISKVSTVPSPEVMESRIAKYSVALDGRNVDPDILKQAMLYGSIDDLRVQMARTKDFEDGQLRRQMVEDITVQAANEGRKLSGAEQDTIISLSSADVESLRNDPKTFLENEYAKRVVIRAHALNEDSPFNEVVAGDERSGFEKLDALQEIIARKEVFQRLAEDVTETRKKQGYAGLIGDYAATMVPGVTWYNMRNLIKNEGPTPFLPGSNLAENIEYLHRLPLSEATAKAEQAIEYLKGKNLVLAEQFANALLSYSSSDETSDNLWIGGLDIASVLPLSGLAKAGKAVTTSTRNVVEKAITSPTAAASSVKTATAEYLNGMKDFVRAITSKSSTTADVLDAAGDTTGAALSRLQDTIQRTIKDGPGADIKSWDELRGYMPLIFNPETTLSGPTKYLSETFVRNLITSANDQSVQTLNRMITDLIKTNFRVTDNALRVGLSEVEEVFKRTFKGAEDTILTTKIVDSEKTLTNTLIAEIFIGAKGSKPFKTKLTAQSAAKNYFADKTAYEVISHGDGFAIKITKPVDLTSNKVRDQMIVDLRDKGSTPVGNVVAELFRGVRSGEDTLPTAVVDAMKRSAYGGSAFAQMITKFTEPFTKIKNPKDFFAYIKAEQNAVSPANPGHLGYYAKSPAEFEQRFFNTIGRGPSEDEATAYFEFVRLNEIDLLARNLAVYTGKVSTGHEMFTIPKYTGKVEGVSKSTLPPRNPDDFDSFNVLVLGDKEVFHTNSKTLFGKNKVKFDRAEELVQKEGYGVIQLSPTGQRQLKDIPELKDLLPKGNIDFVVTKQAVSTPLPFAQVPHRSGVHQIMVDSYVARQPRVSVNDHQIKYYDDINLYQFMNEADAKSYVATFNEARKMFASAISKEGTERKLALKRTKDFVDKNLPMSYQDFSKDLNPKRGRIDPNVEIFYTRTGQTVGNSIDLSSKFGSVERQFIDLSSSKWNTYKDQINLNYTAERGGKMDAVINDGDALSPLYSLRPASYLDPMDSIERGLRDVVRGRHFEELRLGTAERFIAEFGDILDPKTWPVSKQRSDPFMATINADFIPRPTAEQADRIRAAKVYRARFTQFMGVKNEWQQQHSWVTEKILNGVSPEMATGWRAKLYEVLNMEDGPAKLKALAFHPKVGLWNPIQLFVQANTLTHIMGLAGPTTASKATIAAMVQNLYLRNGDSLTQTASKIVGKMGFDADEFIEVTNALERSGFAHVGREVANREQHMNARIVATKFGKVASHGMYFFNKSEEFIRKTAFNAAYMEWKTANPTKRLSDTDLSKIVSRADLFNNNMSQASNAAWQQGWKSVPTQFWSYQVRLTEALISKRLTGIEKARLLATYAAAYGVPVTLSAAAIYPVHENIKQYLVKNKIDTDANVVSKVLNDGMLSLMAEAAFGEKTNLSERYGPSGLSFMKDALFGDKSFLEALGGATGSVFADFAADVLPVVPWITDAFIDSHESKPPSLKDFTDVFTNVSSLRVGEKIAIGLATGAHLNKYGETVDHGYTGVRSTIESIMGLSPARIEEYYTMQLTDKERRSFQNEQRRLASDDAYKMMKAETETDREYYQNRVRVRLSTFTPKERLDAMTGFFKEDRVTSKLDQLLLRSQMRDLPENSKYWEDLRKKYRIEKGTNN